MPGSLSGLPVRTLVLVAILASVGACGSDSKAGADTTLSETTTIWLPYAGVEWGVAPDSETNLYRFANGAECLLTEDDPFFDERLVIENGQGEIIGTAALPAGEMSGVDRPTTVRPGLAGGVLTTLKANGAQCKIIVEIPLTELAEIYVITRGSGERVTARSHQELEESGSFNRPSH
jgi:hypothetical protein